MKQERIRAALPKTDGTASAGYGGTLMPVVTACRTHLVHSAVFSGLINLLLLAPSLYMLQVYDRAVPTRGGTTLLALTGILVLAMATMAVLDWVRARLLIQASARLDRLLAPRVITDLMLLSMRSRRTSAALRECDTLRNALTGAGAVALFDLPWVPIYVAVCFLLHPAIALAAVAAMLLLGGLSWLNERATKRLLAEAARSAAMFSGSMEATLAAGGMLGALGMRAALADRHQAERRASVDSQVAASRVTAFYLSLTKGLRTTIQSLALGLGAYLAMRGSISGGAIFAASLLMTRALAPIEQLTAASRGLIQGMAAYRSLCSMVEDAADAHLPRTRLPAARGDIAVEGLVLRQPGAERAVIAGASFHLPAGTSLGIVGPSGAGKSTLAQALVGAIEPVAGTVRLDGARLNTWDADQLGAAIGFVPQQATMFRGTIRDNIARFRSDATDEQVVEAAREADAHEMILSLPDGYETRLGLNGAGLSGGQAQRVSMARALFGHPALVVLDEPNAYLDGDGDVGMIECIAGLRARGTSVVVIAHRPSILRGVDRLLVLRDGRVVCCGPRDEVLHRMAQGAGGPPQREPVRAASPAARASAA